MDLKPHKDKGDIFGDNKGQVFTIDALFALIIITIIIGLSANALDIVGFKISDYSAGRSMDRIATDAADILINTPGTPGWEKISYTPAVTPGLAQDNNENNSAKVLSKSKINGLNRSYAKIMQNIIPRGASSSLIIYPINSALNPIELGNKTPANVRDVAVVNRSVLVNFTDFKIFTVIGPSSPPETCPHNNFIGATKHVKPNYNNSTPGWTCRPFKVTQNDVNTTSFYIMADPYPLQDGAAKWMVTGANRFYESNETFDAEPEQINDKIRGALGNQEEGILWLHVYTSGITSKSFNTYLVGVPKGTYRREVIIENFNPHPAFFVLKIWID